MEQRLAHFLARLSAAWQEGERSGGSSGVAHELTTGKFHFCFSPRAGGGVVTPKPGPRCCQRKLSTAVMVSF